MKRVGLVLICVGLVVGCSGDKNQASVDSMNSRKIVRDHTTENNSFFLEGTKTFVRDVDVDGEQHLCWYQASGREEIPVGPKRDFVTDNEISEANQNIRVTNLSQMNLQSISPAAWKQAIEEARDTSKSSLAESLLELLATPLYDTASILGIFVFGPFAPGLMLFKFEYADEARYHRQTLKAIDSIEKETENSESRKALSREEETLRDLVWRASEIMTEQKLNSDPCEAGVAIPE